MIRQKGIPGEVQFLWLIMDWQILIQKVKANDDANAFRWINVNNIPKLAFDYENIIKNACEIYLGTITN